MNTIIIPDSIFTISTSDTSFDGNFIFQKCNFEINNNLYAVSVMKETDYIYVKAGTTELVYKYNRTNTTEFSITAVYKNNRIINKDQIADDTLTTYKAIYFLIMKSLLYIMQETKQRKIQWKTKAPVHIEYSRVCKKSSPINKIYLLDDIINYAAENMSDEDVHYHRTCPCWEVRGFFRHYKNGKTVWIKPHRRGKDRLTADPKGHTYIVEREGD